MATKTAKVGERYRRDGGERKGFFSKEVGVDGLGCVVVCAWCSVFSLPVETAVLHVGAAETQGLAHKNVQTIGEKETRGFEMLDSVAIVIVPAVP